MDLVSRICILCGAPFAVIPRRVAMGRAKYCGILCRNKAMSPRGGLATCDQNRPVGEKHHLWKGGKDRRKEWTTEYKAKFPERTQARRKVSDAIKAKRLIRAPCVICGNSKSEAHHENYSKPLEVIWLCRTHHREADKKLGLGSRDFK